MLRERLTPARIAAFQCPPDKKQAFLWDAAMPRLAVRATTGARSFIFESKLNRRTIRITIGDVAAWPLESVWSGKGAERVEIQRGARQEAARLQGLIAQGTDPRELEQEQKAATAAAKAAKKSAEAHALQEAEARQKHTLRALLEAYSDHLAGKGKHKAAGATRTLFKNHVFEPFPDLASKPAR
ncbi:MAG TPA: Arm DNA-binding domain-containing protein, partial [Thioalkalivibrio sp.]|nr:Arm DNA-binding domain-containing protein [Thioalkalivibrio sp.]